MSDEFEEIEVFDDEENADDGQSRFEHYRVEADKGQGMIRVDKFLSNHLEKISRNRIQDAADDGNLFANGKPVKSNYKVKPNDVITIELDYPKHELKIIPQDIPLNIVYEDDDVIVVNKPAGMVVHPGHGNYSGTLVNALAWHMKDNPLFASNDPRPGLVHRIDKDTSGLLVVAKNIQAKTNLAAQFFNKTTERTYIALVWGVPAETSGTITGYIGRNVAERKQMYLYSSEEKGKRSVTHYTVMENLGYVSVVQCKLETGRTHQIRASFKHIGHPLFNDETYGGSIILRGTTFAKYKQFVQNTFTVCSRQALHAKTLGFVHPVTDKFMQFDTELAADMLAVIDKWRNYVNNRISE